MASYREIGGRLGGYIRGNNPSTQQIQSLLSDLLANDELLLPMRDLVSRPCFARLKACAGSGIGIIHRDACLQELTKSYLPIIVSGIRDVINGVLDLPNQEGDASLNSVQPGLRLEAEGENERNPVPPREKSTISLSPISNTYLDGKDESPANSREIALSPLRIALGASLIFFVASLAWRITESSCTYIAFKASNQKYADTTEFRSLIRKNQDRCLSNESFALQYIRGYGTRRCVSQSDGSCIYE